MEKRRAVHAQVFGHEPATTIVQAEGHAAETFFFFFFIERRKQGKRSAFGRIAPIDVATAFSSPW
jgi:hypothetical protein